MSIRIITHNQLVPGSSPGGPTSFLQAFGRRRGFIPKTGGVTLAVREPD